MTDERTGYISLGADINKAEGRTITADTQQGVVSQKLPELTLDMSDEDIIKLTTKWEKSWTESPNKTEWEKKGDDNEKYWLGEHYEVLKVDKNRPNVDNIIFESLETWLPQVTRRNPDPLVELASGEEKNETNQNYVVKVKDKLGELGDENKIRLKLQRAARHWAIRLIGIVKYGWDLDKDIPTMQVVRAKKIILDPDATITEDGYTGSRIGEHRKLPASKILAIIGDDPESAEGKKWIDEKVEKDGDTEIGFIEWWTPEYICWTVDKKVLLKRKNLHWNYGSKKPDTVVDTYGNETPTETEIEGVNHFPSPKMPYEFLVVFNLGDQPMDKTSLIGQNLSNQDRINKRNKQIDHNADNMNGGLVVSLARSGLTEAQGKRVASVIRKGGIVAIPDGNPQEAIYRPAVTGLPADIYNDLADTRSRVRDIFGTRGSSAAGLESENTVRGKILNRGTDTDRIGGGVSQFLEQLADVSYNWFVQLLYVYDNDYQFLGDAKPPKLRISVKEGSLLPKDSTSIANQAIELATGGKMSTLDLYKRLEYPNPEEMAANVWLETNAPQILYANDPRVAQALGLQAQAAAEAEAKKASEGSTKHAQEMERDATKEAIKQGATPSSILAEAPQNEATAGVELPSG